MTTPAQPSDEPVITLYRPVGPEELALVRDSGWRAWPQTILEYWIPAEDLAQLNASIVGTIEVIATYARPAVQHQRRTERTSSSTADDGRKGPARSATTRHWPPCSPRQAARPPRPPAGSVRRLRRASPPQPPGFDLVVAWQPASSTAAPSRQPARPLVHRGGVPTRPHGCWSEAQPAATGYWANRDRPQAIPTPNGRPGCGAGPTCSGSR